MRKTIMVMTCAAAMTIAPAALGHDNAHATHQIGHFLGGVAVGALIGGALAPRPPVYVAPAPVYVAPAPVYVAPAPVYGGYPQAHYAWCSAKYRSYDAPSNSFQPYGPYPRRACVSPYM